MLLMNWKPWRTTHMITHHWLMLAGPTLRSDKTQPHLTVWCPSNPQNFVSYSQGLTTSWSSSWTRRTWWTTPSGAKSGSSAAPSCLTLRCFQRVSIPIRIFQSALRHQISCGLFAKDLMARMQSDIGRSSAMEPFTGRLPHSGEKGFRWQRLLS